MKDTVLRILMGIVVGIATFGVISYINNIDQNAFAVCELVVCAYCALSIFFKHDIYFYTKQTAVNLKQNDNGNGKRETPKDNESPADSNDSGDDDLALHQ